MGGSCTWSGWAGMPVVVVASRDPCSPFGTPQSSQTQKPPRQEKPLEILTSSPPGPAVALPAARRPPGESQTLRGQVSAPKRETDVGLWGSPAHGRAARDRWSNLKEDILESASAQHRLTCDCESLWASVFPSANGDRDSDPLPTLKFLEKTSWSYVGSACRGGGPLWGGCSHGRWVVPALHPARVCLPRWARSEMTSLCSQSFRPAVTR